MAARRRARLGLSLLPEVAHRRHRHRASGAAGPHGGLPAAALPRRGPAPLVAHRARVRARRACACSAAPTARVTFPALPGPGAPRAARSRWSAATSTRRRARSPCASSSTTPTGCCARACRPRALAPARRRGRDGRRGAGRGAAARWTSGWVVFVPHGSAGVFEMRAGRPRPRPRRRGRGPLRAAAGETVVVDGAFLLKAEAEKARGGGRRCH